MSSQPDYVPLFLNLGSVLLVISIGAWFAARRWWRRRCAETWPQATATVESAAPRQIAVLNQGAYIAEVAYSYSVGGEYYAGFIQQEAGSEDAADAFAAGYPAGSKLIIRYRADKPEVSVVLPQDQVAMQAGSTAPAASLH